MDKPVPPPQETAKSFTACSSFHAPMIWVSLTSETNETTRPLYLTPEMALEFAERILRAIREVKK
jgi:hypothetical protein